jgi:hypothetical protein
LGLRDVFVLNPGLIKGQAKVIDDTRKGDVKFLANDHKVVLDREYKTNGDDGLLPLVDQFEKAVEKADPVQRDACEKVFYMHVRDRLLKSVRPWGIPRILGGLGFRGYGRPTYSQKKATGYILMQEDARKHIGYERSENDHVQIVNAHVAELHKDLGVKMTSCSFVEDEPEETTVRDLEISKYFLGSEVCERGFNGYSGLLKDVLKHPWVEPMESYDRYFDLHYVPSAVDATLQLV